MLCTYLCFTVLEVVPLLEYLVWQICQELFLLTVLIRRLLRSQLDLCTATTALMFCSEYICSLLHSVSLLLL
jgi:hypothetical protein